MRKATSNVNLRPLWMLYVGDIAAVSKILQSASRAGKEQLTLDDAIHFDHGTSMVLLMFRSGERRPAEHTPADTMQFACITG